MAISISFLCAYGMILGNNCLSKYVYVSFGFISHGHSLNRIVGRTVYCCGCILSYCSASCSLPTTSTIVVNVCNSVWLYAIEDWSLSLHTCRKEIMFWFVLMYEPCQIYLFFVYLSFICSSKFCSVKECYMNVYID